MTPEARIVCALKVLQRVRQNIEKNGGRYSGAMVPNITSATDVLALPDSILESQRLGAYGSTPELEQQLRDGWKG